MAWVNPAAYALPAVGAYGNTGVGSLRGPAFWQWDQAVSRQFRIGMTQQIELRVEAFNVTDSLRLGNPAAPAVIIVRAAPSMSARRPP